MKTEKLFSAPLGGRKKIVIIGGGVTGTLSALELTQAGHEVTLLEVGALGNGSSSRSAACIRQQFQTVSTIKGMRYSTQYYSNWSKHTGKTEIPIVQNGYLFLKDWHVNKAEIESIVKIQQQAGLSDVVILSPTEINMKFPYIDTSEISCATWCPTDGFLLPYLVYNDAAEAANDLGCKIIQNEEIVSVLVEGENTKAVKTNKGNVFYADIFINAAGVWAPHISSLFQGYPIEIKTRKRYLYFLSGFTEKIDGEFLRKKDFPSLPMIITPQDCYVRPESKKSLGLMMGCAHPTKPIKPSFEKQDAIEWGFGHNHENGYGNAIRKEMTAFFPDIEKMGILSSSTAGYYEDTPDHNPFIGFDPWIPNLIHVAGFSGHGLMHAPFSACIVAHLVDEGKDIEKIVLPFNIGEVDIKTYRIERAFNHAESIVI